MLAIFRSLSPTDQEPIVTSEGSGPHCVSRGLMFEVNRVKVLKYTIRRRGTQV